MPTVQQFLNQSYRLINASNPTTPLIGDDETLSLIVLNQLLDSYAATGLMLTIAQTVSIPLTVGQSIVSVGGANVVPTPSITNGRLASYEAAWLLLDGVQYPLIEESRDYFLSSWLYAPLQGLPRFCIVYPEVNVVNIQIYPAPSQFFQFNLRGKFQLTDVALSDSLDALPDYYIRYLLLAVARDVSIFKGRAAAWTELLENRYTEARLTMEAASEVNVAIVGERESLLNGSWRVIAGI